MTKNVLKFWRFLSPSIITIILYSLLGKITGVWDVSIPTNIKEWALTIPALIIATIYYAFGIGNLANKFWHKIVVENLRKNLVSASGLEDQPNIFTWKAVRGVFFHFVDHDKSLTEKAQLAYFNGLIWTTAADTGIISAAFMLFSFAMYLLGISNSEIAIGIFFILVIVSGLVSLGCTKKHTSIGSQQVEIIEQVYNNELREKLKNIDRKFRNKGN